MISPATPLLRRDMMRGLGTGLIGLAARPGLALAASPADDWKWLVGDWSVRNRKLGQRLMGDTNWQEFPSRSAMWQTLEGLGTIDDNAFITAQGVYRAMGIRAFDPVKQEWAIWWLDARNPGVVDPPVRGRFSGDEGIFLGTDTLRGKPVDVRFHWQGIHGREPHWQQSFSGDGGRTWEMNFENFFTRRGAVPAPIERLPGEAERLAPPDWKFLEGKFDVTHRKLRKRLVGSQDWDHFGGTFENWPTMGGQGNIGDNLMLHPAGTIRGMGFRAWDPARNLWSSWWLDARSPTEISVPLTGGFVDGVGIFESEEMLDGRPVRTRVRWSGIGPDAARWEQSASGDNGASWEVNWVSDFRRRR